MKGKDATPGTHGKRPSERTIEEHLALGVVNLDKPAGPTSHQVVAWLKVALGLSKAGHGGTLDPNVTGVLPVALENGTRAIKTLLLAPKSYVATMRFHADLSEKDVRAIFDEFKGEIYQTPPLKSAVKKILRIRTIYESEILELDGRDVLFKVDCQAGTYVRTLCNDIGTVAGVGANMVDLRRVKTGPFTEKSAVTLHDVKDAYEEWKSSRDETWLRKTVLPIEALLAHLPSVQIRENAVDAVCHGAKLAVPGVVSFPASLKKQDTIAMYSMKGEGVAIGKAMMDAKELDDAKTGIAFETQRVLMEPGTYPKGWTTAGPQEKVN
ncbi:MAG: RNA-guided pseudouridylation complex pseudouridine synthase subunit Cbf5 [Euryarchaeota archaeon]|nr:RNA-guided pseudouridylation complex pseudouridine synthase subunit Cbf5 [Euryarchaeota archaeon]